MDTLLEALDTASAPDRTTFRPVFFRITVPEDRVRLEELLEREPHIVVHDELHSQLTELVRSLSPSQRFTKEALDQAAVAHLNGQDPRTYGVWVHYPWSGRLVHLLDEREFVLVRTDRNRNKITAEEQAILATKRIGVIGLSVGQSVCLTLALERSFGELRIADHDTLELSNLNRIRSGTQAMGHLKTVNVAREIAEIDPYLKVTLFSEGITEENLEAFLLHDGKLDLLVDECDSVGIKILARLKAKALGIPVLMDTSDRGMIDIERFDLEPERPILHGLIAHLDPAAALKAVTQEEKLPFVVPIAGLATLSKRMKGSMLEIGHSVTTWPQLATSVVLGGAVTADCARRIALGQISTSGRWYVDTEDIIADPPSNSTSDSLTIAPPSPLTLEMMESAASSYNARHIADGGYTLVAAKSLAEAGSLAPSGGNDQPWRFHFAQGRLFLFHDEASSYSASDPQKVVAHISFGTCIENIALKARAIGMEADVQMLPLFGEPRLIAVFENTGEQGPSDPLSDHLVTRCTNRLKGDGRPFTEHDAALLSNVVHSAMPGCQVHVLTGAEGLREVAEVVGKAERMRMLNPICHRELFAKEVRWSTEDAERTRDGLDIATFELSNGEALGMRVASDPEAVALLREWGTGSVFEDMSGPGIRSSSAVAMVSIPDNTPAAWLAGGRAAERLWLKATELGWAVHPISAPILLGLMSGSEIFTPAERTEIDHNLSRTTALFNAHGRTPLFMVRLFHAPPPAVRSLRLPLSRLFTTNELTQALL